jgi:hypothetical protein
MVMLFVVRRAIHSAVAASLSDSISAHSIAHEQVGFSFCELAKALGQLQCRSISADADVASPQSPQSA